jgi:hypothetical protein
VTAAAAPDAASPTPAPAEIRAVLRSQLPHLRECYDAEVRRAPSLGARPIQIVLVFTVSPLGRPSDIATEGLDPRSRLARCVTAHLQDLVYPAGTRPVSLRYPITFAPD